MVDVGAGSVIIWDRGWYRSFKPEGLLEQYERGKMELELFGFKLRGRWTLVLLCCRGLRLGLRAHRDVVQSDGQCERKNTSKT